MIKKLIGFVLVAVLILLPSWHGQAAVFCDGVDDVITLDDLRHDGAATFTWAFWLFAENLAAADAAGYIGNGDNASANGAYVSQGTGANTLLINIGAANNYGLFAESVNVWNHWVVVFDGNQTGNGNRLRVWKDGVEIAANSFTGTIAATVPTSTKLFKLCNAGRNASNFARGRMENVMVWYGTALTVGEAQQQFNSCTPVVTTNLKAWLPLFGTGAELGINLAPQGTPGVGPTVATVTGALSSFGPPNRCSYGGGND